MADWFESYFGEDYFQIYAGMFPQELTLQQVDGIISLLGIQTGARILDLACGHGRHSIELAKRGFDVTGYDLSHTFLERAERAAGDAGVSVRWVHGDMRHLDFEAEFDAVINVFTAFAYFEDDREDVEVLRRVRRATKPGGRFLLEIINRDSLPARFRDSDVTRTSDGTLILHEREWDLETDVMSDDVTMISPNGERKIYRTSVRMRTLKQYLDLMREAGLEPEAWYGGLDGSTLTLTSRRLVIVSRRD